MGADDVVGREVEARRLVEEVAARRLVEDVPVALLSALAGRAPRGLIARVGALDGRGPPNLVGPRGPQIADDVLLASLSETHAWSPCKML